MSLSSTSLQKPKDWQTFERATRELIACVINDPKTQPNGRSGQEQNGVDVYGYRTATHIVGVQCKKKFEKQVSEKELRAEVNKAKNFRPRLSEFLLITTAPRDQQIQKCARIITEELSKTSHPFTVSVWGWEDVEEHACKHDEAWKAFDPTWNPFVETLGEKMVMELRHLNQKVDGLSNKTLPLSTHPSDHNLNTSDENTPLHGQITALQRLVDDGHVNAALTQFKKLRSDEWAVASRTERYRILVGIATAQLRLGNQTDAGVLLLDAYNECPEHKNALPNRATGLLLQNRHEEAASLAREILSIDKNNADAASTLIQSLITDEKCTNPLSEVPESLHSTKEVLIGYVHFLRCRDIPGWVHEAKAAAKNYPDCTLLKQFAAEAVFEELVSTDRDAIVGGILKKVTTSEVKEAIELLYAQARGAIDNGCGLSPSLAHNVALALRFADDHARATEILDVAIRNYPEDEDLRLQRALIYLSENNTPAALAVMPDKPTDPELLGVRVEALVSTGRQEEALSLIRGADESTLPEHVKNTFLLILTRSYIAKGETKVAIDLVNERVASSPGSLSLKNLQIQTYRAAGSNDSALIAFEEALGLITENTSLLPRLTLSYQARALGRDEVIVELLKNRVATDRASEGLYVLLSAALNSGSLATTLEILDSVTEDIRDVEWIQRADVILALNSGSSSAEEKVARYLRIQPNNVQMMLAQVRIWQRSGRDIEIKEFLKQLSLADLDGVPEDRIQVATLIIHYGDPFRGLDYAYSVLMDNWDRPNAHLAYQSLIFLTENLMTALPSVETVAENTVVCIVSEGGERRYRIERNRHAYFEDERLTPDNDLAGFLMGKQPGERFVLNENISARPVEIRWVKSVFLDAFHCSLEQFNERFPYADGLLKISIDVNSPDPFEDIRAITKAQAEAHQRMLMEYQAKSLPLSFAAAFIGKDPIDTWSALPTANVAFQVCRGTYEERHEALRTIERFGQRGCMVDAITLSMIRRLGVEKAVIAVCGKIHTTRSVVDSILARAKEAELNIGKSRGVVAWRDGQLVFESLLEEHLQEIADNRNEEASWVKRVAVVVPAIPKKEFSQDTRKIVNLVGRAATDPAVAADGNNLFLLSEDMGYRNWAKTALDVSTVWLQPVLITARNIGALAEEDYCEAVNMLALSGHAYTSLDATCLMHQTRKDNFVLTHELSLLIGILGGPSADLRSNSAVMSAFMDEIMENCTDRLSAMKLFDAVFSSFIKGRAEDQRVLIKLVSDQIRFKHKFVNEYVWAWLSGHSIGMPYFPRILEYSRQILPLLKTK